ncbi:MAG: hypothetical protein QXK88_03805 [Desulfurococcaceae archaeon]
MNIALEPIYIATIHYSRTGNTRKVAGVTADELSSHYLLVDEFRVDPINEYKRPLHANPSLIYDTIVRRGTEIKLKPTPFDSEKYSALVVLSPIWYNTLTPPIQEFLRKYRSNKPLAVVTTSSLPVNSERIKLIVAKNYGLTPIYHLNVQVKTIREENKLRKEIKVLVEGLKATLKIPK